MTESARVRILARIDLTSAEAGGRTTPIVGGFSYRPNHNFFAPEHREMCMGFIDLPAGTDMPPGASFEIEMDLWPWPELRPLIQVGRTWQIQEGRKVVGAGTVLKIIPPAD